MFTRFPVPLPLPIYSLLFLVIISTFFTASVFSICYNNYYLPGFTFSSSLILPFLLLTSCFILSHSPPVPLPIRIFLRSCLSSCPFSPPLHFPLALPPFSYAHDLCYALHDLTPFILIVRRLSLQSSYLRFKKHLDCSLFLFFSSPRAVSLFCSTDITTFSPTFFFGEQGKQRLSLSASLSVFFISFFFLRIARDLGISSSYERRRGLMQWCGNVFVASYMPSILLFS